jgi:CHAD domain-containing protein
MEIVVMSKRKELTGELPLRQAAKYILRGRLRSVSRLVKDVSAGCVRKPEYVHQLRVSIRRAEAAISAFEPCLKPKAVARIRKSLKIVRKAAGSARDCDVHAALCKPIARSEHEEQRIVGKYLTNRLVVERKAAGKQLIAVSKRRQLKKFKRARRRLLKTAHNPANGSIPHSPTLRDAAIRTLTQTCASSRAAAASDLTSLVNLHALRVSGKQVRYAIEVFRACLPRELCDSTLTHLREFQAVLGRVNDARQMAAWMSRESQILVVNAEQKGIPRGTTPEEIHEELRVLLGRFEADLEAAHVAALPQVPEKLDAALKPLEDWLATAVPHSQEPAPEKPPAGRAAEGTTDRHDTGYARRPLAIAKS